MSLGLGFAQGCGLGVRVYYNPPLFLSLLLFERRPSPHVVIIGMLFSRCFCFWQTLIDPLQCKNSDSPDIWRSAMTTLLQMLDFGLPALVKQTRGTT